MVIAVGETVEGAFVFCEFGLASLPSVLSMLHPSTPLFLSPEPSSQTSKFEAFLSRTKNCRVPGPFGRAEKAQLLAISEAIYLYRENLTEKWGHK